MVAKYAVKEGSNGGRFYVDGVCFLNTIDDVARDVTESEENELHVVYAERMRVAAPSVEDAVASALEEIEPDCRDSMLDEIGDAIDAAQKLLDAAFAKLDDREIWIATDREVDGDTLARALQRARFGTDA